MDISLEEKKTLIHTIAIKFGNQKLLDSYSNLEKSTMWNYHHDNRLSKLSTNFDVSMLPKQEKELAEYILLDKDFIAVIIDKMLSHSSIISYSMYRMLYQEKSPEVIIDDGKIFENRDLIGVYISKGGDALALAEMNAELWLSSKIGELYLEEASLFI